MNEKKIAPHIPVIDKSGRDDGSLSRQDFTFDKQRNVYVCDVLGPSTDIETPAGRK